MTKVKPFLTRLLATFVVANVVVFAIVGFSIQQSRVSYEERAAIVVENLSQLLSQNISNLIQRLDLALLATVDEIEQMERHGGISESAIGDFLARQSGRVPEFDSLRFADGTGIIRYRLGVVSGASNSLADRDYFIRLQNDANAGLVISKPILGRVSGQWLIVVARRINKPDGSFGGIVYAGIPLSQFQNIFKGLDLGANGVVSLRDLNLGMVARFPLPPGNDSGIGNQTVSPEFKENLRLNPNLGTYIAPTGLDGINRTVSYRRMATYPAYIIVGLAADDYLAGWRQEVQKLVLMAALFFLATLAMWLMLRNSWKRQEGLKARLQSIFDASPDAQLISDAEGIITQVNLQVEHLLGYAADELIGQSIDKLVPEYLRAEHPKLRAEFSASPLGRRMGQGLGVKARRKDGSECDVEVSLSRVQTEQGFLFVSALRDITERRQQNDRIRELLHEQRLIFDNAHVGILVIQNRIIQKTNQRIADMFGFTSPTELEGKSTEILYCSTEQFRKAGEEGYGQLTKRGFANFETEMRRQDGTRFWVIQTGRPLDPGAVLDAASIWVYTDISERKQADFVLHQSRQMFSTAFESCPIAASIATIADGRFIEANENYERDFGWTKTDLIGKTSVEIGLWPDQVTRVLWVEAMKHSGRLVNYETVWMRKDGERRQVSLSSEITELNGQSCILCYATDITVRKSAEANQRIAAAAFESQECMMITDADGVILRVNQAFVETTGYPADEVVGRKPSLLKSGRHNADFYREMWESIHRTGGWQGEVWDRRKNGEEYPKWLTISAVKGDDGRVTHYIGSHFDITERKIAEEKINELAYFDQLTSLPNRTLLLDRLKQAMTASSRNETHGALLFIDLDNFKTLNDSLGHDMGDLLLKQVAQRLMACVREGDTVARQGGDEFVIMLANLSANAEEAAVGVETVAEKILATLDQAYLLSHVTFRSTASIGITLFKGQLTTVDNLMKQADLAMYKSKKGGRNALRFFDPDMESAVKQRAVLEDDLRRALEEQQFLLHYQAQVEGESHLTGAEVLVRWGHPQRGMVLPADFIFLAEETGLILPLGQWVLETACTQLAVWATRPEMAHLTLAVNVSAHQFSQNDFVDQVLGVLNDTGANPQRLKLELTESLLLENVQNVIEKMFALKAKGVGFSLDDFGTGYSSLSYLKRLPLDQLKIDQSFVRDVLSDPNDAAIAKTIVALAKSLGLSVIAEGVETEAQKDCLTNLGCHAYQGYFFSRPLSLDGFEEFAQRSCAYSKENG